MPTTDSTAFDTQSGEQGSASESVPGNPYEPSARRQEILKADPYYPHTAWRAVVMWLAYFLVLVGCSALVILTNPGRQMDWDDLLVPAGIVTTSIGFQYVFRSARVQQQENWGRIPPRS